MTANFYKEFEDRYRGSRELIKSRLQVYLPFVEQLKVLYEPAMAIDLGCGRGEWLELLSETGVAALGVDIDDGMLSACRAANLPVQTGEAIPYLQSLADESQAVVSGFHIAEHIPFADLQVLVQEALRVLKPAGLLILETPNPENIVVGTSSFYVDPTHQRPIPPQLLTFLPEFYGFVRTKVLRLQESSHASPSEENLGLFDVFYGVSPDYAIVAQKNASPEILLSFAACFAKENGVSLDMVSKGYDTQIQGQLNQLKDITEQARMQAGLAEDYAKKTDAKAEQMLVLMQQADARTLEAIDKMNAIYASRSWQMTAPLRWVSFQWQLLRQYGLTVRLKALLKKCAIPVAKYGIGFLSSRPELRQFCMAILRKIGLYAVLRSYYLRAYAGGAYLGNAGRYKQGGNSPEMLQLSPRSQRVYSVLKDAVEKQQGEK